MMLTAAELASLSTKGPCVTQKCNGCGKLLNQTVPYTIAGRREVYCSAAWWDTVLFRGRHEGGKNDTGEACLLWRQPQREEARRGLSADMQHRIEGQAGKGYADKSSMRLSAPKAKSTGLRARHAEKRARAHSTTIQRSGKRTFWRSWNSRIA